jgi:hypothetical protein
MPIFISYSHNDKAFVETLAKQLVAHNAYVWVDRWELRIGDSITERVQKAMSDAAAILFVLSKSSVASEWCKKELSAGLIRELDERRVVVMPVLVEDCEIPLLLRDKMYADFRTTFDQGFKALLQAIAAITSERRGRTTVDQFIHDWAYDWQITDSQVKIKITAVSFSPSDRHSILTEIKVVGNSPAARRYKQLRESGNEVTARLAVLAFCAGAAKKQDIRILLADDLPNTKEIVIQDTSSPIRYTLTTVSRRMGDDNGTDVLCDVGFYLQMVQETVFSRFNIPGNAADDDIRI